MLIRNHWEASAGFYAGRLAFGDVGFCGGRKTGEPRKKTHGAWWKPETNSLHRNKTLVTLVGGSPLTSASLPAPQLRRSPIWFEHPGHPRPTPPVWKASELVTEYTVRFVQFDESCPIYCLCITRIFPSIWFGTALLTVLGSTQWRLRATKTDSSFCLTPTCAVFHSCLQSCRGSRAGEKMFLPKYHLCLGSFGCLVYSVLFIHHIVFRNYRAGART